MGAGGSLTSFVCLIRGKYYNKMDGKSDDASRAIEIVSEGLKSIVREVFHLGYNRIDSLSAGLLHIVQSPCVSPALTNFPRLDH